MMRNQLHERNAEMLADIEMIMQSISAQYSPTLLSAYKIQLLTLCEGLRRSLHQNVRYIELGQDAILDDILSRTKQNKQIFDLLSSRLTSPLFRAVGTDQLPLAIIAWQHRVHSQIEECPAAFIDGSWAIWPFLQLNMPLYYVPAVHQRGLRFLPLLFHELGHLLYVSHKPELDELVAALKQDVADMLRPVSQRNDRYATEQTKQQQTIVNVWYHWAQELFCDAVGFMIGGPSYVHAFSSYVNMLHSGDFAPQPETMAASNHPVTWIRIRFLTERAAAAGFTDLAQAVNNEWRGFAKLMNIVEDYHGFYLPQLHTTINRTLEDMLTEVNPHQYTEEDISGESWSPQRDSPVRLLNLAWRTYLTNREQYTVWERQQIQLLIENCNATQRSI